MARIENWDEFAEKAKSMLNKDPINCRVTLKYRHNDGKIKIKATDNKKCHHYLAEQQRDVKNIDKFMLNVMSSMVTR